MILANKGTHSLIESCQLNLILLLRIEWITLDVYIQYILFKLPDKKKIDPT